MRCAYGQGSDFLKFLLSAFFLQESFQRKTTTNNYFEFQHIELEVENIRYQATSNPNIVNQRLDLIIVK